MLERDRRGESAVGDVFAALTTDRASVGTGEYEHRAEPGAPESDTRRDHVDHYPADSVLAHVEDEQEQ
jgi:hypothetical protein